MALRGAIASLAQGGPFIVTRKLEGTYDDANVYRVGPTDLTIADDVIEAVDTDEAALTLTAHGLRTGDGPVRFTTTGALPAGLAVLTNYYAVVFDDDTIGVATSIANALAIPAVLVDLSDEGSGVNTLVDVPGTTKRQNVETYSMVASIQPVTGATLRDMPDASRADETIVIYTQLELRTRKAGNEPDVVTYDGEPWFVTKVEKFRAFGDVHYRAYASRTESP